jgi:hypothetical protein
MSCATLMGENNRIDLALAGNTVLIYRVSLLSAVGGKCTSFCGVAKSDGCSNRGDPLCFSWVLNCLSAFTPATIGSGRFVVAVLCVLLRLMVFWVVSLK